MSLSFILYREEIEGEIDKVRRALSQNEVSKEYRGYAWSHVPVPPHLRLGVAFSDVAYTYCPTMRYLFLKRQHVPRRETREAVRGRIVHDCILGLLKEAIDMSSTSKPKDLDIFNSLGVSREHIRKKAVTDINGAIQEAILSEDDAEQFIELADKILNYEYAMLVARVGYKISHTPRTTREGLMDEALPIVIEPSINAQSMGFSDQLTPDFIYTKTRAIGELKTGTQVPANRVAIAGYALACEYTQKIPIDVGFVLYVPDQQRHKVPIYEIDVFPVSNEYREAFIQKRNQSLNLIASGVEPPVCNECHPGDCRIYGRVDGG